MGRMTIPEEDSAKGSVVSASSRRGSFVNADPDSSGSSSGRDGGPETWTYSEVEAWLVRIKCGQHTAAFREKCVDGMALSGMLRYDVEGGAGGWL